MTILRCSSRVLGAAAVVALASGAASAQFAAPVVQPPPRSAGAQPVAVQPQVNTLSIRGVNSFAAAHSYPATYTRPFAAPTFVTFYQAAYLRPSARMGPPANAVPGLNAVNPAFNFANPLGFNPLFAVNVPFAPLAVRPWGGMTGPSVMGTTSGYTAGQSSLGSGEYGSPSPAPFVNPQAGLIARPATSGFLPWIW